MKIRSLLKLVCWTVGMSLGVYLIIDGKTQTPEASEHALIGAVIGFLLGAFFVWQQREKKEMR